MPTSENNVNLRGDEFRSYIRAEADCPTCNAPKGYFCKDEETGGRRLSNHHLRVTAVTGQDLTAVNWRRSAVRRKKRREGLRGSWA